MKLSSKILLSIIFLSLIVVFGLYISMVSYIGHHHQVLNQNSPNNTIKKINKIINNTKGKIPESMELNATTVSSSVLKNSSNTSNNLVLSSNKTSTNNQTTQTTNSTTNQTIPSNEEPNSTEVSNLFI